MIILDEKMTLPPPPPYVPSGPVSPPPFPSSSSRIPPSLPTVPPHILLKIVYETFTHTASIERQRKTLYWLNTNLRFVSRAIYVGEYTDFQFFLRFRSCIPPEAFLSSLRNLRTMVVLFGSGSRFPPLNP